MEMTDDKEEEPVQEPRENSLSWRFLSWLSECREQKEAQRLKEEQRYERWAAEVGLSAAGEGSADGPKKRMTRLEKAALR